MNKYWAILYSVMVVGVRKRWKGRVGWRARAAAAGTGGWLQPQHLRLAQERPWCEYCNTNVSSLRYEWGCRRVKVARGHSSVTETTVALVNVSTKCSTIVCARADAAAAPRAPRTCHLETTTIIHLSYRLCGEKQPFWKPRKCRY